MKVTTRFDFPAVPVGEEFTVRLMIGLVGDHQNLSVKSRPINLTLAIDRSGSMAGSKLKYALEATRMIADMMEQQDVFSLVTFNDKVETVIPSTKGADLKGIDMLLNNIKAGGDTFLSGGFEGAFMQAHHARKVGVSRIVLLSDGIANKGITDRYLFCEFVDCLRQKGSTTTTFGVGDNFDEELMTGIAESGGGNAYFIENPIHTAEVFSEELDILRSITDTNCGVSFTPSMGTIKVNQLNTYYPEDYAWSVGDVSMDEERRVVLAPSLPVFHKSGVNINLGEVTVISHPVLTGTGNNDAYRSNEQRFPINISIVEADQFNTLQPDTEVMIEAALLSAARVKNEARRFARDEKFDHAASVMERMANDLKELGLTDHMLDAEIHDLYNRAARLRKERETYYSKLEDKRLMYDADMTGKSKKMNLMAHRQRQTNTALLSSVAVLLRVNGITGDNTLPVTMYVNPEQVVSKFLKEVFKHLKKVVPAYTYGTRWCLRERGTGRVYDIGSIWAQANGIREDDRTLAEAGIVAGLHLDALMLPVLSMQTTEWDDFDGSERVIINVSRIVAGSASIQYHYQPHAPACDFLALVYSSIAGHVPANAYGKQWLLRDMSSGRVFDTGSAWAQSVGCQTDIRPLKMIGIQGGSILQVVPLPPVS